MKNKGFTLIELLAVIVILAIIALIAVPIVLGIIKDTQESATLRSAELYYDAVNMAVANKMMSEPAFFDGVLECSVLASAVDGHNKGSLDCGNNKYIDVSVSGDIPTSGKIKFTDGKTTEKGTKIETKDGKRFVYSDGKVQEFTQTFKPQYYGWILDTGEVTLGSQAPSNSSTTPPSDKTLYLGYDVNNGVISAGYVCFVRNSKEYCLKGYPFNDAYSDNDEVIEDAYAEVVGTNDCSFTDVSSFCNPITGNLGASASSSGTVYANSNVESCEVSSRHFGCVMY